MAALGFGYAFSLGSPHLLIATIRVVAAQPLLTEHTSSSVVNVKLGAAYWGGKAVSVECFDGTLLTSSERCRNFLSEAKK